MGLPEQERQRRLQQFLQTVTIVRKVEQKPKKEEEQALGASELKLLIKAGTEPGTFLLTMYRELQLHPVQGRRAATRQGID